MYNEQNSIYDTFSIFIITIMVIGVFTFGIYIGTNYTKKEAIKHNAAVYQVDKMGKVSFKWNDELLVENNR